MLERRSALDRKAIFTVARLTWYRPGRNLAEKGQKRAFFDERRAALNTQTCALLVG